MLQQNNLQKQKDIIIYKSEKNYGLKLSYYNITKNINLNGYTSKTAWAAVRAQARVATGYVLT